jgi:hypothetical protein
MRIEGVGIVLIWIRGGFNARCLADMLLAKLNGRFYRMGVLENYDGAHAAFISGAVLTDSNEKLITHLHGLTNQNNTNTGTQHRDIIRGLTINHILLQRHIDGLNRLNNRTQNFVIALTLASLFGTGAQVWYAAKADKTPEAKTPSISAPAQRSSSSSPSSLPPAGQPLKKAP